MRGINWGDAVVEGGRGERERRGRTVGRHERRAWSFGWAPGRLHEVGMDSDIGAGGPGDDEGTDEERCQH